MANAHKQLRKLLEEGIAGKNPDVDAAAIAAGYVHGPGWVVHSTADVARFLGLSNRRVQDLLKEGMPRQTLGGSKFAYDLAAIAQWRLRQKEEMEDDEDLYKGNSPELERLRKVQREIKEAERDILRKKLADLGTVREGLAVMGSILRSACDQLQRQFGDDARKVFAAAVGNYERELRRQFGDDA